jgi:uncharacterized alkaline shock family protein YloU
LSDEATAPGDRTLEMFLPAAIQAPIPDQGGAGVVEVPAYRGSTSVGREVVEKIAGAAARAVPGVAELGGDVARFMNSVLDKIGLDEVGDATRGVSARVEGTKVAITVVLVIAAGEVVSDVTVAVRTAVIEAVENYGLHVENVNVKVDDIRMTA